MFVSALSRDPQRLSLAQCSVFLVLLIGFFSVCSEHFFSSANALNVLTAGAVIGLMACGATFVIAAGGIDLSTAAVMALSSVVAAIVAQGGGSLAAVLTAALICGACCGAINGGLLTLTAAPSFVITLGMMSVARAAAYILTDGTPIYGLPDAITSAGQGAFHGLPWSVIIFAAGLAASGWLLAYTKFGAHTLIFGDNPQAARAAGISRAALLVKVYALAGMLSGLAGFVFMARTNSGDPSAGQSYELIAITAVILGGANLFGGRAGILGTFVGVLCLGVLQNGLNLLAIGTFYQILFVGLVLLAAAFLRRSERQV